MRQNPQLHVGILNQMNFLAFLHFQKLGMPDLIGPTSFWKNFGYFLSQLLKQNEFSESQGTATQAPWIPAYNLRPENKIVRKELKKAKE